MALVEKQQVEEWNSSIKYTILQTFKWSVAYWKSVLLTAVIPKTLAVQTAGWNMVRHTFVLLYLRGGDNTFSDPGASI